MPPQTLGAFIVAHHEELVRRCRAKVMARPGPPPTDKEVENGIPQFLDDISDVLSGGRANKRRMHESATQHGADLFFAGFTLSQVVHDYGAVCQSITDLALELSQDIGTDDFRTLNKCLDDAIAGAVSEHARFGRTSEALDTSLTLRNLIETAIQGFEVLQSGKVGVDGATGALVYRCLLSMRQIRPMFESLKYHDDLKSLEKKSPA